MENGLAAAMSFQFGSLTTLKYSLDTFQQIIEEIWEKVANL